MTRTKTIKTLSAILAAGALTLTACGGSPAEAPGGSDEPSTQTEGSDLVPSDDGTDLSGSADVNDGSDAADEGGSMTADGEWSYKDDSGEYKAGEDVELPEGFPDEVPQPSSDWKRTASYASEGDFMVSYAREGATPDDCAAYFAEYSDWDEEMRTNSEGWLTAMFSNSDWTVVLGCDPTSGLTLQATAVAAE